MIVEVAGLPGSGKSTLLGLLREAHPEVRWMVPLPVPLRGLHDPVARGRATALYVRARARRIPPQNAAGYAQRLAALLVNRGRPTVFEEGPVHFLWRDLFLDEELHSTSWQVAVRQAHPLVVLRADREVRIARIAGKARPGQINRVLKARPERWVAGEALFEQVLEATSRSRAIHSVDTGGSVEQARQRLERTLADAGVLTSPRTGRGQR